MDRYQNREAAGKILALQLQEYADRKDVIVLALPRGGVPVGYEIANELQVPLDVFIVRKLGVPGHHELAMGAIAIGGIKVLNHDIVTQLEISDADIDAVVEQEETEIKRRLVTYRGSTPFPSLKNKTIILVDDGIATGATMKAAILSLRQMQPQNIIVAVPVADAYICEQLRKVADKVICPLQPTNLQAVGLWYEDFSQTDDAEVRQLLEEAGQPT